MELPEIGKRARCSECGGKGGSVQVTAYDLVKKLHRVPEGANGTQIFDIVKIICATFLQSAISLRQP
jgi:hypothetical protein